MIETIRRLLQENGRLHTPIETLSNSADLYEAGETAGIPAEALLASLGCGNPTALAELSPGETVLDLGSGGGIDVLLERLVIHLAGLSKRRGNGGKNAAQGLPDLKFVHTNRIMLSR